MKNNSSRSATKAIRHVNSANLSSIEAELRESGVFTTPAIPNIPLSPTAIQAVRQCLAIAGGQRAFARQAAPRRWLAGA